MKNHLKQTSAFLACCIAMLAIFLLAGCKDNEEEEEGWNVIAKEGKPFNVENATGRLYENTKDGTWEIVFDNVEQVLQRSFGDEEGAIVVIKNMKDEYKKLGTNVKTSGIITLKVLLTGKTPGVGPFIYKYDYEITDIEANIVNAKNESVSNTTY